ncbi:MAG TPA: Sec-independent protein translocase protein TatB [Gallionella sp.]|jgi:sec-independent protein translocase protein TatB|nr:Sec-independent protein translocase protein TatB [Gallionella sp.]
MFDIAFSELLIIMLVALVVIGPERLPKVARTAGHLWGRIQRYVQNVKSDIANDLAIQEARQLQAGIKENISNIEQSTREAVLTAEQEILQAQYGASAAPPGQHNPSVTQTSDTPNKPA